MQSPEKSIPPQNQKSQPGIEAEMRPLPESGDPNAPSGGKLKGKVAVITGGDSGIGRAVAIAYAREGAEIAIIYLNEHSDAEETRKKVEEAGKKCLLIPGDVRNEGFCFASVEKAKKTFGRIDIIVNNAAEQHDTGSLLEISAERLERTFQTNIFAYFYLCKAALPHLSAGSAIINTSSVTAYRGSAHLLDYAATKGAIVAFTRSLSLALVEKGIWVNGVAPGPVWTPLIPATFPPEKVESFGKKVPMGRPGQPEEIAPSYVFLASDDASYMSGQFLHPNGGEIVNT